LQGRRADDNIRRSRRRDGGEYFRGLGMIKKKENPKLRIR